MNNGFSYKNVYDEIDFSEALCRISDEKTIYKGEERISVSDDIKLLHKSYSYEVRNSENKLISAHSYGKYSVIKNGEEIYSFINIDDQAVLKDNLIMHSSGRRYLAFHVDLYGISFLDTESREVYNYVPEGSAHDEGRICGESFIITDIHYDKSTDLVAYGGCYWAAPCDVYVGDLNDPLNFDPHLISMRDILDPDWDNIDDIDFVRFEDDILVVSCDGTETAVPIDTIIGRIRL